MVFHEQSAPSSNERGVWNSKQNHSEQATTRMPAGGISTELHKGRLAREVADEERYDFFKPFAHVAHTNSAPLAATARRSG